jgi:very-short-patch-repair endonuclease
MVKQTTPRLKGHARQMRQRPTRAEARIWNAVRDRKLEGFKFRRQAPFGPYIVDFLCEELQVVIELDGSQHSQPDLREYDDRRTTYLMRRGYRVIRIPNELLIRDSWTVNDILACAVERE